MKRNVRCCLLEPSLSFFPISANKVILGFSFNCFGNEHRKRVKNIADINTDD